MFCLIGSCERIIYYFVGQGLWEKIKQKKALETSE
jgi:hypothetical protein